jgi:adenylate cyclase
MRKFSVGKKFSQQYTAFLVGTVITIVVMGIYAAGWLDVFEKLTVDWRIKAFRHDPHPDIVTVAFTEDDMKSFGKWPWHRGVHAEILEKITAQEPKIIGMDIVFADPDPGDPEGNKHLEDITKSGNIVYPVFADPKELEMNGRVVANKGGYLIPLPELAMAAAGVGHDNVMPDNDGKVRSIIPKLYNDQFSVEAFPVAVAKGYLGISGEGEIKGAYYSFDGISIPLSGRGEMMLAFAGPPGTFPSYSYTDILEGRVPAGAFKDKIVLIGSNVAGVGNFYGFPLSSMSISQVQVFANAVDTIINKNFFKHTNPLVNVAIILFLGLISTWIFIKGNPARNVGVMLILAGVYVGIAYGVCLKGKYLINMTVPAVAVFTCYLGNIAYGFIAERKERMKITQTFGRYVAPQVVDEILRTGDELLTMEGRMQYVSVLFVDVSGFTTMSEKLSPVSVVKILNRYFKEVIEASYMYEGTVDKFIGDAVMVVFNAPLPIERHEEKAVRSGLEIQRRIAAISPDIEKEFGMPLGVSLGINSGEAIIGNIGAMNRVEYATIGDTVNAAARLQSLAGRSRTLISGSTYEPIKDIVEVNHIGPQKVKGKAEEVQVYEVLGFKQ